jgi:tellurite methyltransferase
MSTQDRTRWDAIYRESSHLPYPDPDPLLFEYTPPVDPKTGRYRALDLAAGMGQNGLWVASQGYTVDIIDISREGLTRARREMAARNLRNVNLLQIDLDEIEMEEEAYHLVCVFRYLKRDLFPEITACVAPGGRVVYETFNVNYLESVPEFNPAFLLQPGELATCFPGWKILHESDEGHISQVVALKP